MAQQSNIKLITANFQNAKVEPFVIELELQTAFHFYYDAPKFDSLRVTLNVTDKPLETVLDLAFANKDFHYTIIRQEVFLTKGRTLKPHLIDGYFNMAPPGVSSEPN